MGKRARKVSKGAAAAGADLGNRGRVKRRQMSLAAAVLLFVGGGAGSVVAAGSLARNDAEDARRAFEQSAAEVASTLQLAIQHQEDLIVNAGALFLGNPLLTNDEFVAWANSAQVSERYSEVQALGYVVIVTAADLPVFAARALANPLSGSIPAATFEVVPPGERPSMCLSPVAASWNPVFATPAGFDYCSNPLSSSLMNARDSGVGAYFPYETGTQTWLAIQSPIYAGGAAPETIEARQAAFVAWVAIAVDANVVLDRALQGHPGGAVTLRHQAADLPAEFSSGEVSGESQSFTIDLHNGWTVETFAAAGSGSVWDNGNALALLVAGATLSALLGVLVLVLTSGRARALRLVAERTGELRGAQAQLVDSARQAGMAEIATNVLHNVGNVLNSVNVSANLVREKVRGSKSAGLAKAVALMRDHADDLGGFLTTDARGRALPGYLDKLAGSLAAERDSIDHELLRLTDGVAHIKEIVSAQQSLAGLSSVIEPVTINDLVEDALRMSGIVGRDDVAVTREFAETVPLMLDRHRILLILVNVINNAVHAMQRDGDRAGDLVLRIELDAGRTVSVSVADNGVGIPAENLTRIFAHGFTTHAGGHGFGLHSSALAAKEMGGELTVHSDGSGTGAVFTLELPLGAWSVAA